MDPVEFRLKNLQRRADDPRPQGGRREIRLEACHRAERPGTGRGGRHRLRTPSWPRSPRSRSISGPGHVQVKRVVCAQDMGLVINPEGATIQMEGCITMGLGYALTEDIHFKGGMILDRNFDTYELPRFSSRAEDRDGDPRPERRARPRRRRAGHHLRGGGHRQRRVRCRGGEGLSAPGEPPAGQEGHGGEPRAGCSRGLSRDHRLAGHARCEGPWARDQAMRSTRAMTRRDFLRRATHGLGTAMALPTWIPASALGRGGIHSPSERITMGFIGVGGQGGGHLLGGAWTYVPGGYGARGGRAGTGGL